jgi:hypothetical protein
LKKVLEKPASRSLGRIFVTCFLLSGTVAHSGSAAALEKERPARESRIRTAVSSADLVFVGLVEKVGQPPRFKSGRYKAAQPVTYMITEVLKGQVPGTARITVQHVVLEGSRNANPRPGTNELSPSIFKKGNRLIVMTREERVDGREWVDVDEDFGTLEAREENLKLVRTLLTTE